jgi:hypothetical protein
MLSDKLKSGFVTFTCLLSALCTGPELAGLSSQWSNISKAAIRMGMLQA